MGPLSCECEVTWVHHVLAVDRVNSRMRFVSSLKLEGHSVERIRPPRNAWSTRTYRAQFVFEISCRAELHRFWPDLNRVKNHFQNLIILSSRPGFGSSPKSNQFVLATHPTCPPSFIWTRKQLFDISCSVSFLDRSLNGVPLEMDNQSFKRILRESSVAYDHTTLNTPDLVWSRKLSRFGPSQYLDGRLPV